MSNATTDNFINNHLYQKIKNVLMKVGVELPAPQIPSEEQRKEDLEEIKGILGNKSNVDKNIKFVLFKNLYEDILNSVLSIYNETFLSLVFQKQKIITKINKKISEYTSNNKDKLYTVDKQKLFKFDYSVNKINRILDTYTMLKEKLSYLLNENFILRQKIIGEREKNVWYMKEMNHILKKTNKIHYKKTLLNSRKTHIKITNTSSKKRYNTNDNNSSFTKTKLLLTKSFNNKIDLCSPNTSRARESNIIKIFKKTLVNFKNRTNTLNNEKLPALRFDHSSESDKRQRIYLHILKNIEKAREKFVNKNSVLLTGIDVKIGFKDYSFRRTLINLLCNDQFLKGIYSDYRSKIKVLDNITLNK